MTGFFEAISISAPHIYHSTLLLSPKMSIVRTLYGPQASPLARVVQGVPTSWDPNIATTSFPRGIRAIAWSPCSRFIAISQHSSDNIAILDAVTLEQIYTTCSIGLGRGPQNLVFSPDSHLLTGYFNALNPLPPFIASYDLQTGGLISKTGGVIDAERLPLMTYSGCGTMIGLLFRYVKTAFITTHNAIITTYNVLSGTHISSHSIEKDVSSAIWTHDECLRFATVELRSIIIWEVGFTSIQPPTKVDSLPTPDGLTSRTSDTFLPSLSLVAFVFQKRVLVWDARHHKILLDSAEVTYPSLVSCSPDGRFIVCGSSGPELYILKASPDGYLLQKFITGGGSTSHTVSPDGESVITFGSSIVQLWRTTDSPTSLSGVSIQPFRAIPKDFILEFSPGEKLVAVTRRCDSTVTVLDLESGNPRAVIDAGEDIYGIGITGSAIVVVCVGKVVTWDLPAGDDALNVGMNIDDSVQTNIDQRLMCIDSDQPHISVSPDFNHIAIKQHSLELCIFNLRAKELLAYVDSREVVPGFTLDGHIVWCAGYRGDLDRWRVTEDGTPQVTKLESLGSTDDPPEGFPWRSSHGYQVTGDGWILSSRGKRLLWLPHHWRSQGSFRKMWRGKFLALLHAELSEPVVLELEL